LWRTMRLRLGPVRRAPGRLSSRIPGFVLCVSTLAGVRSLWNTAIARGTAWWRWRAVGSPRTADLRRSSRRRVSWDGENLARSTLFGTLAMRRLKFSSLRFVGDRTKRGDLDPASHHVPGRRLSLAMRPHGAHERGVVCGQVRRGNMATLYGDRAHAVASAHREH